MGTWRDSGSRSHAVAAVAARQHGRAAVLAGGIGAVASHRSAAHALGLLPAPAPRAEITVPSTSGRRRPRIVVHRVAVLPELDTAAWHGVPITTVPRTLLDLSPRLARSELARACHEAWVRHRMTPGALLACIARNPAKKGAAKLRRAMTADVARRRRSSHLAFTYGDVVERGPRTAAELGRLLARRGS